MAVWVSLISVVQAQRADADLSALRAEIYDPQWLVFSDWQYRDGHDPNWAGEHFDASDWAQVTDMDTSQIFAPPDRWYRLNFTIGWHYRTRSLGLYLGSLGQSYEVYINGKLLGKAGGFDEAFFDAARVSNVYQIPTLGLWYSFLSFQRENVLAIRVQGQTQPIRFETGRVQIDDYDKLILTARELDTTRKVIQGGAISILLFISLFCAFLFVSGFRGKSNSIFGGFVLLAAVAIFLDSLLFYDLDAKNTMWQRLIWLVQIGCVIFFARLVRTELSRQANRYETAVEAIAGTIAVLYLFSATGLSMRWLTYALTATVFVILLGLIGRCIASMRFVGSEAFILSCICGMMIVGLLHTTFVIEPNIPLSIFHASFLVAAFSFLYPIARQFQDMTKHTVVLSERIVSVRDLERTRLARDMHDGLGQGMAAISLHLKILAENKQDNRHLFLSQAVDDLTVSLGEVIQNLRPAALSGENLSKAISNHLKRTLEGSSISLLLGKTEDISLNGETKEQIFRICQEALNNAIKHSECRVIDFSMVQRGGKLNLVFHDDGKGFRRNEHRARGLGLSTMRERASLINGSLMIRSNVGMGTTITLEIGPND